MIDWSKYPNLRELVDGIPERAIGLLARSELDALLRDVQAASIEQGRLEAREQVVDWWMLVDSGTDEEAALVRVLSSIDDLPSPAVGSCSDVRSEERELGDG